MIPIDEESQAMIQSFTSWASSKGYHVIGALIGPKEAAMVRIFATAPEGDSSKQTAHAEKLLAIVNHAIKGKTEFSCNLPIGTN